MHTGEDQTRALPSAQTSSPSAASASQRRMVVPDIARSVMLWGIAIAMLPLRGSLPAGVK